MYCKKCGKYLNENDRFCPECGSKIEKDNFQECGEIVHESKMVNEYLFLRTIKNKYREKITYIDKKKETIFHIIFLILTVNFIFEWIDFLDNYKLIVHVIRYVQYIVPYLFVYTLFEEIILLITIKKKETNKNKSKIIIILFEVIYILILFIISDKIANTYTMTAYISVLKEEYFSIAFFRYLIFMKGEILALIIMGIFKYYINKKIFGYCEETC